MTQLTPFAVATAAKRGGWPQDKIAWVVATSFGESGWRTDATASGAPWGDGAHTYYGLTQISDIHKDSIPDFFPPSENWKEPVRHMAESYKIYKAQGETAFSGRPGHSSQADSQMGAAQMAAAQVVQITAEDIANNGATSLTRGGEDGTVQTIVGGKIWDALGLNAENFAKLAWIGGGSILVLVGVLLLAKSEVLGPVGKVLK